MLFFFRQILEKFNLKNFPICFLMIGSIFLLTEPVTHAEAHLKDSIYLSQLIYEIRNPATDISAFQTAIHKIGQYLGIEVLQNLPTREAKITTLTGDTASHRLSNEDPVLVTLLRAGLPLLKGVQSVFPQATVGFLATSRNEESLKPVTDYIGIPDVKNKIVIIIDTMLATGGSLVDAIQIIEPHGPKEIQIVCAIASQPGIDYILSLYPRMKIYAAAIDSKLNDRGYIVPGLGDAGDRSYGKKTVTR